MNLFHLRLIVGKADFGCLCRQSDFFTGIYSSLDAAVLTGTKKIMEILNELRGDTPLSVFVKEEVFYTFQVTEFDPEIKFKKEIGKKIDNVTRIQIDWKFDYMGNILDRIEWRGGIGYTRFPGDKNENAGTHFHIGDFVTSKNETSGEQQVYLIASCPGRRQDSSHPLFWENIYRAYFIPDDGNFSESCHAHFHESVLQIFTGTISSSSALSMLKNVLTGKKKLCKKTTEMLFDGIFSLSDKPDWRTIRELSQNS